MVRGKRRWTIRRMRTKRRTGRAQRRDFVKETVSRFVLDDEGQDMIEYGLLIGIITVAAITAIVAIGPKVGSYFGNLNSNLP